MTTSATINVDGATAQEFEDLKHRKTVFEFLPIISIENTPYGNSYVYCFEVEDDLHGFVTADGTFVGQSFGYQGYKNDWPTNVPSAVTKPWRSSSTSKQ